MEQLSSSFGSPAPYGHACESCAQSKCKCIIRPVGGPCERCLRLRRECRPAQSIRRRHSPKRIRTKRARLEEKLDDLVSLIKSGGVASPSAISPQASSPVDNSMLYNKAHTNNNAATNIQSQIDSGLNSSKDGAHNGLISTLNGTDYLAISRELSPSMAEECLASFRVHNSKFFPFVFIPSTTSAYQLWEDRPFLWSCIMTIGSKSTSMQQILGKKIRQIVAQEMIVQSTKSIDLLLGLLTFVGWSNCQLKYKPFLSLFTQLAISLIFDLGLGKPVPKDTQMMLCGHLKISRPNTPRTMEERRAVLGCFLITSIISSFLQKTDALRWTPHMDECLQILDARKECPNDEILVQQVRLQLIVERVSLSIAHDEATEAATNRAPAQLYLESPQSQLQSLKARLLTEYQDNAIVLLHLYSTELETALSPSFFLTNQVIFHKDSLNRGLESAKSWFDVFFTLSPAAYVGFPFSIFSQLLRCLMTLYRLKTLHESTWDGNGIWATTDALLILDRVIGNMNQVASLAGLESHDSLDGDVFNQTVRQLQTLRPAWESKLRADDHLFSTLPTFQNMEEISMSDSFGMEFFDSDWLTDPIVHSAGVH